MTRENESPAYAFHIGFSICASHLLPPQYPLPPDRQRRGRVSGRPEKMPGLRQTDIPRKLHTRRYGHPTSARQLRTSHKKWPSPAKNASLCMTIRYGDDANGMRRIRERNAPGALSRIGRRVPSHISRCVTIEAICPPGDHVFRSEAGPRFLFEHSQRSLPQGWNPTCDGCASSPSA